MARIVLHGLQGEGSGFSCKVWDGESSGISLQGLRGEWFRDCLAGSGGGRFSNSLVGSGRGRFRDFLEVFGGEGSGIVLCCLKGKFLNLGTSSFNLKHSV